MPSELLTSREGSTLIHCAAGKDRTGVCVAVLLRLMGVDRAAVMTEFLLTAAAKKPLLHRLAHRYGFTENDPMMDVSAGPLDGVFDYLDAYPGGAEGWYVDKGGASTDVARLRARLIGG